MLPDLYSLTHFIFAVESLPYTYKGVQEAPLYPMEGLSAKSGYGDEWVPNTVWTYCRTENIVGNQMPIIHSTANYYPACCH
jgi:hypothetical protein